MHSEIGFEDIDGYENGFGNPNAKIIILGTDPTACVNGSAIDIKRPFNLDEKNEYYGMKNAYFSNLFDTLKHITGKEDREASEYIKNNILVKNAVSKRVFAKDPKTGDKKYIYTADMFISEKRKNRWLEEAHKEELIKLCKNQKVIITSGYLLKLFDIDYKGFNWDKVFTDIEFDDLKNDYDITIIPMIRFNKYRRLVGNYDRYLKAVEEILYE